MPTTALPCSSPGAPSHTCLLTADSATHASLVLVCLHHFIFFSFQNPANWKPVSGLLYFHFFSYFLFFLILSRSLFFSSFCSSPPLLCCGMSTNSLHRQPETHKCVYKHEVCTKYSTWQRCPGFSVRFFCASVWKDNQSL